MAAVLRVKRRCDEEPLEALVFACKRRKKSEADAKSTDDPLPTVVKLAATVKTQEDDISLLIPVNEREDIWKSKLGHKVEVLRKIRKQRQESSENSRFKVVNCFRHIDQDQGAGKQDGEADKRDVIVFDVESSLQNAKDEHEKAPMEEDVGYVYDIYYGHTSSQYDFASLEHLVDIMPYSQTLDFGPSRGAGDDDDESFTNDEDDDSNDENNWRNDYPDSDNSVNEDDMRLAMQMGDMNIDRESDDGSSSDEDLVYGIESDPQDVEHYGEIYAKYKARIQREFNEYNETTDDENEHSGSGSDVRGSEDDDEDPVLRFM